MATTLQVHIGISGLTLTCDLFPEDSDTPAVSGVALTEATNRKGLYTADVDPTGWHIVKLYSSAVYFPAALGAYLPGSGVVTAVSDYAARVGFFKSGSFDSFTFEGAFKLMLAALAGRLTGGGSGTESIYAANNSKVRITAVTDESGNRITVTLDATD